MRSSAIDFMRSRLPSSRWIVPVTLLAALFASSAAARAQDDAAPTTQDQATSLGDLARNLRTSKSQRQAQSQPPPTAPVIDNDNLNQMMEDAQKLRPVSRDKTVFSIDPATDTVKVSSPDVTCSLSFNARASSLLIKPIVVEDLPIDDLVKLDGPGFIQDDNLQLEVFNGTDWELREITIGLTLERKPGADAELAANARVIPAAQTDLLSGIERHSDVTILYHLKAQAKPFSTTTFSEEIGTTPSPDEDWRWSIIEAKGIRPSQPQPASDQLSPANP
jgi:hypothetical protein